MTDWLEGVVVMDEAPERQALLLVEDDPRLGPLIVEGLRDVYDVTLIADGAAGLQVGQDRLFDVMVIDRRLPGLDGIELVRRLRIAAVHVPILFLTALGAVRDKIDGLDVGANDYLVKPFDFEELRARLRALTRTFTSLGDPILIGQWQFYPAAGAIHSPYDGRISLTERETDLLKLFADNPERVFSRQQILTAVFSSGETLGTVDTYVHYLRRKVDRDIIDTVRKHGYRLGRP
ncbi:MAG: Response regulator [Microbacteriaceae bacterium]|nr:Response regulator [Microbacteriaceae bacterium]